MISQSKSDNLCIACFISSHGFGHASRASAVMEAMLEIRPSIRFEIFSAVPQWFFQQLFSGSFTYHNLLTDIGLIQETPLREDLPKTLQSLNNFLPFDHFQITNIAEQINRMRCQLVICDIAPMGIMVAQTANIPSVLVENFTWDWIYEGYACPDFPVDNHIEYLQRIFKSANYHIQTEPVCNYYRNAYLITQPISRKTRTLPQQVRQRLGIPENVKLIMITMGGIPEEYIFLNQLTQMNDIYFVIPGSGQSIQRLDNTVLLPHCSDFFHQDLVNACDVVIGKLGYSTLSEVYNAGVPYGYITRSNFRESKTINIFVKKQMNGCAISEKQFQDGSWISFIPDLIAFPRKQPDNTNGAIHAAQFICKVLNGDNPLSQNQKISQTEHLIIE